MIYYQQFTLLHNLLRGFYSGVSAGWGNKYDDGESLYDPARKGKHKRKLREKGNFKQSMVIHVRLD